MNAHALIQKLGEALGFKLELSHQHTCAVFFDHDEIIFEKHEDQLYIIADLGSAEGRADAHTRLLEANYLGAESGQACFGLDIKRQVFTLHRILDGELSYEQFEQILLMFIRAMRYWKEWLAQPQPVATTSEPLMTDDLRI